MVAKIRVLNVVGTRPEAVKMAPVILGLRREPEVFDCRVVATAQHRELLDQVLNLFGIRADVDFDIMEENQQLPELTARLIPRLDQLLDAEKPDWVLAQGDTTTVFATALACYYRRIRCGHVEAGLRTGNKYFPYPEEINRVLTGQLADLHFAPTRRARENLLAEGVADEKILVTGNPVVDALLWVQKQGLAAPAGIPPDSRLLLLTAHRRENFGKPLEQVFRAVVDLCEKFPDVFVLYPVHPNPNVKTVAEKILGNQPRVKLCAPLSYKEFVAAMAAAYLILSDSGGVQEEAPSLGKPVLVLRDETERPEAMEAGTVRLVGPHREAIVQESTRLLEDEGEYGRMAEAVNPYGDGHAAERICAALTGKKAAPFTP